MMPSDVTLPASWPVLKSYDVDHLARIALPLGGIGTGTVSVGGRGDLRDFEIVNRPAKGFTPANAFFAIQVQRDGAPVVARCLEGQVDFAHFEGSDGAQAPNHGLPRFSHCRFDAAYPLASVHLSDTDVPVTVRLDAFNPLIPADIERSSYPVAVLRYVVHNPTDAPLTVSVCGCLPNFIGNDGSNVLAKGNRNTFRQRDGIAGLFMESDVPPEAESWGTMALVGVGESSLTSPLPPPSEGGGDASSSTLQREEDASLSTPSPYEGEGRGGVSESVVSYRTAWARKTWNGDLLDFWDDFSEDGQLSEQQDGPPIASLCQQQTIAAGGKSVFTFLIAWHFPNRQSWSPEPNGDAHWLHKGACRVGPPTVGNWYTTQFADAWDAAAAVARDLPNLEADTVAWVQAFCDSDLPTVVKEAALFNVSTLRTQTLFRLPDGNFYGWEGMHDRDGSCFGSCTHVWNYEQASAFLFGELARNLRQTEFAVMTDAETGHMAFRVGLPTQRFARQWRVAAADGQMGCLMKLYRDWKLSGDDDFLHRLWPQARKSLEFCWLPGGWDADRDGVMEGCQHNTMDVEYYGPNPQMGFWYLGALRASAHMARHLGEADFADECDRLFENGSRVLDETLFNGEYYEHHIVPPTVPAAKGLRHVQGAENIADPELQLGAGCLVDQLVGQYMAHVCGLGYLADPAKIKTTLGSLMRYNFKENLRGHFNHLRTFALQDESAFLMATYPLGRRPTQPFPYYNEVMTGFEHQAAAHLLYEDMAGDALKVIGAIRDRYDGLRRSPFNEAECGHHYARAMAAWAHVLALTGFHYDGTTAAVTFAAPETAEETEWFWSSGDAWGTVTFDAGGPGTFRVGGGSIAVADVTVGDAVCYSGERRTLSAGDAISLSR